MKDMDLDEMIRFLNLAIQKDQEEKLYMQWCAMLPQMSKYMTFTEFSDHMTGRNIDMRDTETILKEIEELHKKEQTKHGS